MRRCRRRGLSPIQRLFACSLGVCSFSLLTRAASAQQQPLQVDADGDSAARSGSRIHVMKVGGTVSRELAKSITEIEEQEIKRGAMSTTPIPNQADAVLTTIVVDDANGCTVRLQLRIVATGEVNDDQEGCTEEDGGGANGTSKSGARTPQFSHAEEILRATRVVAIRTVVFAKKQSRDLPPLPLLPPPPPEEPPPPPTASDGWVFEVGLNLRTRKFIGLGQMVAATNQTERFGGVFTLTFVRNDIQKFAGVLEYAFGRTDAAEFRGGFGVALVRNKFGDFAGIAAIAGGVNHADSFTGVSQIALYNSADHFVGLVQLGGLNHIDRSFAGAAQIGAVNLAAHDYAGAAQIGLVNASYDGKLNAGVQLGGLANVTEQEVRAGIQASPANLFGRFKGGVQLGLANLDGSKSFGDFFEHWTTRGPSNDFKGALQFGAFNGTYSLFEGGAQLGLANLNGKFSGAMQVGALINVESTFEGAFQIGLVNILMKQFSGFAGIGAANVAHRAHGGQVGILNAALEELRGAQLGAVNLAGDARGAQIGIFNYTSSLRGVQIGVLSCINSRDTLPCTPIANVGF